MNRILAHILALLRAVGRLFAPVMADLKAGADEVGAAATGIARAAARKPAAAAEDTRPDSTEHAGGIEEHAAAQDMQDASAAIPEETPPMPPRPRPSRFRFRNPFDGLNTRSALLAATSYGFLAAIIALYVPFVLIAPRVPKDADIWDVSRPPSIVLLDNKGAELTARGARYGETVTIDDLPPQLVQAFLSTEDRRFYTHGAIDMRGLVRALVENIRAGNVVQGGSTITQQLAKNLYLSSNRTITRKAREALLSLWLEGRYTKDEILSLYLNRIYLGSGAYGVEAAARTYFGKSARDVSISEAALLAGLPKAPSKYDPTRNLEGARARAREVIGNLLEVNAITPYEARIAEANPAELRLTGKDLATGWFFDHVVFEAQKLLGPDAPRDMIIRTTLDPRLQHDAALAVDKALDAHGEELNVTQGALIAYDKNGGVVAMIGGRDYGESQFNRATQAKRQPGSAFKLFVYLAAMEHGMTPNSRFIDQPITVDGWSPSNYENTYAGPVRLTQAVAKSINTVAVQVQERAGRDNVIAAARRLGITSAMQPVPSLALGAMEVSLDQLTAAYQPFSRNGLSAKPHAILEIQTAGGQTLYKFSNPAPRRLVAPKIATEITQLLYQVIDSGTGRAAKLGPRPAAGKTGTTNEWRDAWFVGYTAQLTAGVWVGNDDNAEMKKVTGGGLPADIWRDFMLAASEGEPIQKMPGAYPAVNVEDESALIAFYSDLGSAFRTMERNASTRRGWRLFGGQ